MEKVFVIPGRLPGMNEYTEANRRNWATGARMKKKTQKAIETLINEQIGGSSFAERVNVFYEWYEPNKRRDLDNISGFGHKVIMDALVSCRVLKDDGWNNVAGYCDTFFVDNRFPRIIVKLKGEDSER